MIFLQCWRRWSGSMTRRRWPGWLGRTKVGSCQFGSNLVLRKMVFIAPGFRFILLLCRILRVIKRGNVPTSCICQVAQIFWQKLIRISKNSRVKWRLLRQWKLPSERKQSLIFSLKMIRRSFNSRSFWQSWILSILIKQSKFQPKPTFLCWVLRLPTKCSPTWTPSSDPALRLSIGVAPSSSWATPHTVC